MKKLNKLMAVLLSLTLCLGMVAPAFAASFDDLQNAISAELPSAAEPAPETPDELETPDEPEEPAESVQKTEDGSLILGTDNHYGFGWNQTDNRFGIEAWDDDATGRNVLLKESVEHERGDKNETITVKNEINLDLNGNTIKGQTTWKPIITVTGEDASLTLDGEGTISGVAQAGDGNKITHGVSVKDGASLTMKNGTLTNFNNAVVVEGGSTFTMEDGEITDNNGAGVRVKGKESSFTMENGTISENNRGGVRVTEGAFFEMKDGTITKNNSKTEGDGSGVWVDNSTFNMSGGSITENYPSGGIAGSNATIELIAADPNKPIEISNNQGIGIHTWGGSTLTMDGVMVNGNTAGQGSGINTRGDKEVTLKNVTLEGNKGGDSAFFSWKTGNVKIENSTIKNNESSKNTVWICYNTAEIKNSTIDGNGANAIAAEYGVKMTVNGKTLYEGYADQVNSDGSVSGFKKTSSPYGATILVLDAEGNTTGEIRLPQGADIDKDGNIIADLIIDKTYNEDGSTDVIVTVHDCVTKIIVPTDKKDDVNLSKEGVTTLPAGAVANGKNGETICVGDCTLDENGGIAGASVTKVSNEDGTVTIKTDNGKDGDEGITTIAEITLPRDMDSSKVTVDGEGTATIPNGSVINGDLYLEGAFILADGTIIGEPYRPVFGDFMPAETEVDDPAIPLAAGPVTRAQFIDYLWRHEGEPEAEGELFADHEYAPAIAWALSVGLIDEAFQPDEIIDGTGVKAILGNFANVIGTNAVAVADLTTLTGADDEAVLNCDQVLAQFFGEEYVLPEELDSLESDIAA